MDFNKIAIGTVIQWDRDFLVSVSFGDESYVKAWHEPFTVYQIDLVDGKVWGKNKNYPNAYFSISEYIGKKWHILTRPFSRKLINQKLP
jgi:hypothetical protein